MVEKIAGMFATLFIFCSVVAVLSFFSGCFMWVFSMEMPMWVGRLCLMSIFWGFVSFVLTVIIIKFDEA